MPHGFRRPSTAGDDVERHVQLLLGRAGLPGKRRRLRGRVGRPLVHAVPLLLLGGHVDDGRGRRYGDNGSQDELFRGHEG